MTDHVFALPALDELAGTFAGALIRPGDPAYDEARRVWNGLYDRHPGLIARPSCTEDVVAAVGYARDSGLPVAVRGGGHSAVGYGTVDDGIVIDLSEMNRVDVDPDARIAKAQAGATWAVFDHATQEHGLAVTGGRFSTTGIAGLTLGSGSGWLERRCGLAADNLIEAEVVLADGTVVTASEEENADLFWGLRGGGGNFGIVTRFTYRLHQIGPVIYGGMLLADPSRAHAILEFMRDYMRDAPDDLGTAVAFINAPPELFVPKERHLTPVVAIVICWTGEHAEGQRIVGPIKDVAQPFVDLIQPLPYEALQTMLDAGAPKGINAYMAADFMDDMSDAAIAKLIEHGARRPGPMTQLLLEPMGGAISRVPDDATALGRRDVRWCYHALAFWMEPDAETADDHFAWAKALDRDMKPESTSGVYLNFTSDHGDERVRATFGEAKFAKLVALKDKYDPANLFRLNQNVPPSGETGGGNRGI